MNHEVAPAPTPQEHVFNRGVKVFSDGRKVQDAHFFFLDKDEIDDKEGKIPLFTKRRSPDPVVLRRISTKTYPSEESFG